MKTEKLPQTTRVELTQPKHLRPITKQHLLLTSAAAIVLAAFIAAVVITGPADANAAFDSSCSNTESIATASQNIDISSDDVNDHLTVDVVSKGGADFGGCNVAVVISNTNSKYEALPSNVLDITAKTTDGEKIRVFTGDYDPKQDRAREWQFVADVDFTIQIHTLEKDGSITTINEVYELNSNDNVLEAN